VKQLDAALAVLRTGKVSDLPVFIREALTRSAPIVIPALLKAIVIEIGKGNNFAMKLAAEIYGLTKGPSINTVVANFIASGNGGRPAILEAVLKAAEEREVIDVEAEPAGAGVNVLPGEVQG